MIPIAPGARLGPYEILAPIGAGGMGEVFRARDTRLDRTVAIKILSQDRSQSADMRKRFDQEARAIASLSHQHICHLNDVGHQDGIDFLVMEYLQGETLANRLARAGQPLRLDEVIRYAVEIAEALSDAHRHGIVHRDLKPANVFLARTGGPSSVPSVKLLDFGLAKLRALPLNPANSQSTQSPQEQSLTEEGAILGTWRYMAPEQLEGKEADARTDIFAFGVVAYEMATGKKPFDGESHASVIAAILDSEPAPISALQPSAPPALVRIVTKCLAKNPDARWQSARDLADALRWIGEEKPELVARVPAAPPSRSTMWRWIAVIVATAVAAGAIGVFLPRQERTEQPIRRLSIIPPADVSLVSGEIAISPDGRYLAYSGRTAQGSQIYLRPTDQVETRVVAGSTGGYMPTFSPDSQQLVFETDGKLKKTSLAAGATPITLCDFPLPSPGISWMTDNDIVVGRIATGLFRVSGQGGPPIALTTADPKRREIDHHSPSWLPGGKALLVTVHKGAEAFDIAAQQIGSDERTVLVRDAFDAKYVPTGHLVFVRGNTLYAATFDAERLTITGPEISVLEDVATVPQNGIALYAIANDGSLAYVPTVSHQGRRLAWVDRRGATEAFPLGPNAYVGPRVSPEGRRLAVQIDEGSRHDIWVYDFGSGALTRVTFDGASEAPVWTSDGRRITFSSTKEGRRQIYWQPIDSPGKPELLIADEHSVWAGSWSPGSDMLAYVREKPTGGVSIGLFRVNDRGPAAAIASDARGGYGPRISPDGRWLAYAANETTQFEIYVTDLPGEGIKRQVSTDGGSEPVWSPDGHELFYRNGARSMVVSVASLPSGVGKPTELPIRTRLVGGGFGNWDYDVSADGRRLLVVEQAEDEVRPRQIQMVLNWFAELKARVSSK